VSAPSLDARERVAIFGGSFNPPHVAHLLAVTYVLACSDVDRVVVVPVFRHPFAKSLAPFAHRLEMCRLTFADLARVSVSAVEEELGGESLTVRTLEHLQAQNPGWAMRLIVGGDVVHEMDRWTQPDRIRALASPIILGRVGVSLPAEHAGAPLVLPEVSSTSIRAALARDDSQLESLLPRRVLHYIRENALYRS
jgi:nicotinate-nucleotide adenylyltransferase